MIHPTGVAGVIANSEATAKLEAPIHELDQTLQSFGVNRYAYFCSKRHGYSPSIVTNLPNEWLSEYEEDALYRIDPVLDISKSTALPFSWLTEELNNQNQPLSTNALKYKINRGYTFIAISHGSEIGILTLCLDDKQDGLHSIIKKNEAAIQFCLIKHHEQHRELSSHRLGTSADVQLNNLSCREKEVLRWIAVGKTYSETATILGITERTIKFHVANIKQKLDVYSSRQMASIASEHGLI